MKHSKIFIFFLFKAGTCPELFRWFFSGKWSPLFLNFQDAKHMVVKAFRALMTKELKIGTNFASRSVLLALTRRTGKEIVQFTEAQLSQNKDRMDYEIASKACDNRVLGELKRPEEKATKAFLVLMQHMIYAFVSPNKTPEVRIYSAFFLIFFCRMWRFFIDAGNQNADVRSDAYKVLVQKNFISSNLAACIEINGHSLLILHNYCRDTKQPEQFLPSELNSQTCESAFRTLRAMTSTRSTIINFDMYELLNRSKRLRLEEEAPSKIKEFIFRDSKNKNLLIPEHLLSDEEINEIIKRAFQESKDALKEFRKF